MGIFDIIGPIMIGPSSSHTAGAARIGQLARLILNDELTAADITPVSYTHLYRKFEYQ